MFRKKPKKEGRNSRKTKPEIVADPMGSYTGKPLDPKEKPVQDADDL